MAKASPLGLFAEEIESETGEQIGNFPQAFSHLGVIHAAMTFAYFAKIDKIDMKNWAAAARAYRGRGDKSSEPEETGQLYIAAPTTR